MQKENILHITPGLLIRHLARPYVAGYSMQEGIARAEQLVSEDRLATIDLLGEESKNQQQVSDAVTLYLNLISRLNTLPVFTDLTNRPTVSIKLSALVVSEIKNNKLNIDDRELEDNVAKILQHALAQKVEITIDMEDYHWTDTTLELYKKFFNNGFPTLGAVLQSRLFRTEADIEAMPDGSRVRLCIGIYKEGANIAYTDKTQMKNKLLQFARRMLEKNMYLELGTHDEEYLKRFFTEILPDFAYPEGKLEIQMLLGVPRAEIQNKITSGEFTNGKTVPIRLYVPFAVNKKDATQYSKRRLIANPDLITYGIKNIIGRISGKDFYRT